MTSSQGETPPPYPFSTQSLRLDIRRGTLCRDISTASEDTAVRGRSRQRFHIGATGRNRSSSLDLRRVAVLRTGRTPSIHKVSWDLLKAAGLRPQFPNILSRRGTLVDSQETVWDRRFSFNPETNYGSTDSREVPVSRSLLVELDGDQAHSSFASNGQCFKDQTQDTQKCITRNRGALFVQRKKICDFCLAFALLGFASMIIEAELTSHTSISKENAVSLCLRTATFLSTVLLVISVAWYHITELKIYLLDTGAEDWRLAMTARRVSIILLEMLVCSICPLPGTGNFHWFKIDRNTQERVLVEVPIDVLLSIPMFLRTYLLGRAIVLHSRHFQDTSVRTIAALNRTPVDFRFVLKTFMTVMPIHVLMVFTLTYWLFSAWILTLCERTVLKADYLNSIWLVIVTFMSIGYGDIVPQTYCGRSVAILTGIVGTAVSSVLIAVVSKKMELTKSEKHVNYFMADNRLDLQQKHAAAALLQHTWSIYKYRRFPRAKDVAEKIRYHQKKFLSSILRFRRLKTAKRTLNEASDNLMDLHKMQSDLQSAINETRELQQEVLTEIRSLKTSLIRTQSIHM